MAVSRPFVLAALGALLALASFTSMRSAAERAEAGDAAAAPQVVQPASRNAATPRKAAKPRPAQPEPAAAVTGVPPKVAKALGARRTVVLFFRQPAADDAATAAAVASVRGVEGASVFTAPITELATYRGVTSGLGVSQAPAVVIVGKNRQAQLIEGYVDPATLRQQVKDAR